MSAIRNSKTLVLPWLVQFTACTANAPAFSTIQRTVDGLPTSEEDL